MSEEDAGRRALEEELTRLRELVETERRHAEQWREVAEERRVQLERLRQHPVIALVFEVANVVLPVVRRARHRVRRVRDLARRWVHGLRRLPEQVSAPQREQRLRRAVAGLPPASRLTRSVSLVVLTRDGRENLERLLPALRRTVPDDVEVVVVDNDSSAPTADWLAQQDGITLVRNDRNLSFSAANERGAEVATGEVLCFLNDDVEPLGPGWLERLVAALDGDGVVAAGAQLVYPRRPLGRSRTRDLGVQHAGIGFRARPGQVPQAHNLGHGEDPRVGHGSVREVAAVTAACLVVRARDHAAVGGFDDRYSYGAEDVDLCWRLRSGGRRVVVVDDAVLFHHEGATRHRETSDVLHRRQQRNWDLFAGRFGPAVHEAVTVERLEGGGVLSPDPFHVAITVTRDLEEAGYGDWYTAHELGEQFAALGWRVSYVERYRDAWYDLDASVDAVVVLLDVFDVRRVRRPGLTTIAWIRNWTDRWTSHPWFDDYDVVLASSRTSADMVAAQSRHSATVFPLATNPARFAPPADAASDRSGVVLTANHWGVDRDVEALVRAVPDLRIHGKGWEEQPAVAANWHGHVAYDDLPAVYCSSLLVLDQAADHTRPYGSVNSRVFDALAAGALPVTNQVDGARELFGDELPTYDDADGLAEVVGDLVADPGAVAARVSQLRATVLDQHTYAARARQLQQLLLDRARRPSIVLATSVPDRDVASTWGDWHLAEALGAELRAAGHEVEMIVAAEWDDRAVRRHDVFLHVKGRSRAPRAPGQFHVIWNISHPEELPPEECDDADLVLVASHTGFDQELATRTTTPVEVLLQATDERRFVPRPPRDEYRGEVAFVGNSRFVLRPVVRDAVEAGLDLHLYGGNWEKFLDPALVRRTHVPNDELPSLYSSVDVLLNDHWDGMREHGFASNRLFDALACATPVVSDAMPGLDDLFHGGVVTYTGGADGLAEVVGDLLADEDERRRRAEAGRAAVLARHTFRHRAAELLDAIERHRG